MGYCPKHDMEYEIKCTDCIYEAAEGNASDPIAGYAFCAEDVKKRILSTEERLQYCRNDRERGELSGYITALKWVINCMEA